MPANRNAPVDIAPNFFLKFLEPNSSKFKVDEFQYEPPLVKERIFVPFLREDAFSRKN